MTIHQPWAALVASRRKRVETRDWPPPPGLVGGPLLIHAGKDFSHAREAIPDAANGEEALRMLCETQPFLANLILSGYGNADKLRAERGHIVAIATIDRAARMTDESIAALRARQPDEHAFGFYAPGRYAWVLRDVVRITPVLCRGAQKIWRPPADVLARIPSYTPRTA